MSANYSPSMSPTDSFPPVLTAEAMRAADENAIEDFGIPSFTLMESAGRAIVDSVARHYGPMRDQTVAIICGKGNNGGDGLVVARQLFARGATVDVTLMSDPDELRDDPAHNLQLLRRLIESASDGDRLAICSFDTLDAFEARMEAVRPDLFVDAMLGTGLTSDVRAPMSSVVQWLNDQAAPVVAVDVPTGLHSNTGAILGDTVAADHTVTMAAYKSGLLVGEGPRVAGSVEVAEIGIPAFAIESAAEAPGCARLTADAPIRATLPTRAQDAHKYSAGMALVVGGAPNYTGAPVMTSRAAARIGAGYVMCATAEPAQSTLATKMTEIPTQGLPTDPEDGLPPGPSLEALQESLGKARALCIGPGLGRASGTQRFVRDLLEHTDLPVVIDADGLNALAGHIDTWSKHANGQWILTPHVGEFRRLTGGDVSLDDRLQTAASYAERWNSVLILKGMPSVVGCPDGSVYINGTGNPALATAGTGDVLSGFCAGLLAQGLSPKRAALSALHIGGAVADEYAAQYSAQTMQALDLIDHLPHVLTERFRP